MLRDGFQHQQPERNAEQGREHKPSCAAQMNMTPVLYHHNEGYGDRSQYGHRSGDFDRYGQREQRDGHERLAESERGANDSGEEQHRRHLYGDHFRLGGFSVR